MTLLHEYLHYDLMIQSSFGSIVDNPDGEPGYGPVAVYDRLPKDLARVNADSYAYYAAVSFDLLVEKLVSQALMLMIGGVLVSDLPERVPGPP